ncbi:MAG TPA: hypothetical protein VK781_00285 [Solirubrobacteraceae bacterium]|jgi:hypothetical protein|nr:hypothetical protein [Solirubrobacteraceae bacterium]
MSQSRPVTGRHGGTSIAVAVVAALVLAAVMPAPASADVGMTIIRRCIEHQSIAGYSATDYRRALREMPTEAVEYSGCSELITEAELALAGLGAGGTAGGNQQTAQTPAEQHTIQLASHSGLAPVLIGDHVVVPGVVHANITSIARNLPASLLAMIVLLSVGLVAAATRKIASRIARSQQS